MGLGIAGAEEETGDAGGGDSTNGSGDDNEDTGSGDDIGDAGSGDDDNDADTGSGGNDTEDGQIFYIGPEIWEEEKPSVACEPPCILVLPPKRLQSDVTITFPVATETIEETWEETTDGSVVTVSTTITTEITVPPVVTADIQYSNIVLTESNSEVTLPIETSIVPPPITLTGERGITWTYSPGPEATETKEPIPDTDDSEDNDNNNNESENNDQNDDDDDYDGFGLIVVPGPIVRPPCVENCGTRCSGPLCGGGGGGGGGGGPTPKPPCFGIACPPGQGSCVGPSCSSEGNDDDDGDRKDDDNGDDEDDDNDDECENETVTNYWVSCSGTATDACTTTSSEVVTGCSMTGEATTTTYVEQGCPLITIGDFYDNFADFGGKTENPSTTTYSSSVLLDRKTYQVNEHMNIVIGQTAFAIPSATAITTAEINGHEAIIVPEHTGLIIGSLKESTTDESWPTTTIYPWPTQTEAGADASAYCYHFDTENGDWPEDLADSVIKDFCSAKKELKPDGKEDIGHHDTNDDAIAIGAEWAEEQSGCGSKASYTWSSESDCLEMFEPMIQCEKWGGGHIFKTGDKGCIRLSLIVNNPKDRRRRRRGIGDPQRRMHKYMGA